MADRTPEEVASEVVGQRHLYDDRWLREQIVAAVGYFIAKEHVSMASDLADAERRGDDRERAWWVKIAPAIRKGHTYTISGRAALSADTNGSS